MTLFWRVILIGTLLLSLPASAVGETPPWFDRARAIFSKHDPHGRLQWTAIGRLGDVRVGRTTYTIYNLSFVNYRTPARHGMQQVAIIKDDRFFVGSYLDVGDPMVAIRGRTVIQKRLSVIPSGSVSQSFTIGKNGPPRRVLLGGKFVTLEKSI